MGFSREREDRSEVIAKVKAIASGEGATEEKLRRVCSFLREEIDGYDWVGIYYADSGRRTLTLGPYAGEPTEHVKIPFGRGVCGQVAELQKTVVIDDVSKEANYLSCSVAVRSEIVVPILRDGELIAELDIDSHTEGNFDEFDVCLLSEVCGALSPLF